MKSIVLQEQLMERHYRMWETVWGHPEVPLMRGRGSYNPKIVLVREQPTQAERDAGQLFPAGNDELILRNLTRLGLSYRDVWYTVLFKKIRPIQQMDGVDAPKYASAARVLFDWELDLLKPVVVMGIHEVPHRRVTIDMPEPTPIGIRSDPHGRKLLARSFDLAALHLKGGDDHPHKVEAQRKFQRKDGG